MLHRPGNPGTVAVGQYEYDATNRMVAGVNEGGEESRYVYNGLGYLVANEWEIVPYGQKTQQKHEILQSARHSQRPALCAAKRR